MKIARNKRRDRLVTQKLRTEGWTVLRVWHHQLSDERKVIGRIGVALLGKRRD